MSKSEIPTPEILDTLDWEGLKYVTVKAALELDVFNIIAKGHHAVKEIAHEANASTRGMEILLNALCPLGFLTKSDGRYELTPMSETYLVTGNPSYSASIYLNVWHSRDRLVACVKNGSAEWNLCDEDQQEFWKMYASQELVTWPQRCEVQSRLYLF